MVTYLIGGTLLILSGVIFVGLGLRSKPGIKDLGEMSDRWMQKERWDHIKDEKRREVS